MSISPGSLVGLITSGVISCSTFGLGDLGNSFSIIGGGSIFGTSIAVSISISFFGVDGSIFSMGTILAAEGLSTSEMTIIDVITINRSKAPNLH